MGLDLERDGESRGAQAPGGRRAPREFAPEVWPDPRPLAVQPKDIRARGRGAIPQRPPEDADWDSFETDVPRAYDHCAPRGALSYAAAQHPAVHRSLMEAAAADNPAVRDFIDLHREAETLEEAEDALAASWAAGAGLRAQEAARAPAGPAAEIGADARPAEAPAPARGPLFPALAVWLPAGGLRGLARRSARLASLGVVGWIGLWGWQQAQRDIAGLPVIHAPAGPARETPAEPGGELARHVGLAVNSVAAVGIAARGPDQVTLAPRPMDLAEEDAPMATLAPLPATALVGAQALRGEAEVTPVVMAIPDAPGTADTAETAAPEIALAAPGAESRPEAEGELVGAVAAESGEAPGADADAVDLALAEALGVPVPEAEPEAVPEAAGPVVSADVPGLAVSPRPPLRPARLSLVGVQEPPPPTAPAPEVAPEDLAPGTRLVQLGAFDSPDLARAEWQRVSEKFEPLMQGRRRVIQEAVSGGRSFYRLRVEGFDDLAEARQFCAALAAERANCIPAQVR